MYANLVFHNGIDHFYQRCAEVGVDSVLIADVPFEESAPFRAAALRHGIAPILSARLMPTMTYCEKSLLMVEVTLTCYHVPESPVQKITASYR